jgi:cell division septation protein DedD
MVLDYSDRRPVTKNRPRKQPIGLFIVILLGAVALSFVLGFASGWLMRKPVTLSGQPQQASVAVPKGGSEGAPAQTRQQNPESGSARNAAPPLTFYQTLPRGEKAIIGSGLNPRKSDDSTVTKTPAAQPAHKSHPVAPQSTASQQLPPQHASQQTPGSAVSEKAGDRTDVRKMQPAPMKKTSDGASEAGAKATETAGKFCVQVMSSQERKEAESVKSRLTEKGLPAYIVESRIKERGTWYRVRIGRHLTPKAADTLSARAGKGAMVLPE